MAQERKKRRIVLASVLKPVDDTRMFEKMGVSLSQSEGYEVTIIGYPSSSQPSSTDVRFISLEPFKRISLARWSAKWHVFRQALKLRPSILIFNTHELLLPAIFLKIFIPAALVYDVRENYYRNILHSGSFPSWIGWPLALLVRFKEKILAPAIDHFFLAERAYESEFKFHRGGWTVLENKAQGPVEITTRKKNAGKIRLLFSGTLAEGTGVFQAIKLAKALHLLDASVSLKIIGYAALKETREKIRLDVAGCDFIEVVGSDQLVPHPVVLASILNSDFGIISYPPSHHTKNSHPTKLFEYLSAALPIVLDRHWPWTKRYEEYQPFAFFDFVHPDYPGLLADLKGKTFYTRRPDDVTWKSEETKLLKALANL